jgi:ABC-type arginine/histidine transport system permease subunit
LTVIFTLNKGKKDFKIFGLNFRATLPAASYLTIFFRTLCRVNLALNFLAYQSEITNGALTATELL